MKNSVFIATSLDGYIADSDNNIDWLNIIPNPNNIDLGYIEFNKNIDALLIGRKTFETVCNFDCDWPYDKPVFVISNSLKTVDKQYIDKVEIVNGPIKSILKEINNKGYHNLYIDGGTTIQSLLKEDLISDLIITTIPVLLGSGVPLFKDLPYNMQFNHIKTEVFLKHIVQSHYSRKR